MVIKQNIKRFFSLLLFSILTSIIISCSEDYGPEIEKLKEYINQLQNENNKLKEVYDEVKIIKCIEPITTGNGGWKIMFSDDSSIDILSGENGINGIDGVNGISPYLKIDNDGYWVISYDQGETYTRLYDNDRNPISARGEDGTDGKNGIDGTDGISVDVRINNDGYYEIITYRHDKNSPISVISTQYSANPNNIISSIVEDSKKGIITITMTNGDSYSFLQAIDNVSTKGCVLMSLGDSITTESYYIKWLRKLLQIYKYYNLAVSGAWWSDKDNTKYDGNPVFNGADNNFNNVLGNQVQKIIDNPELYSEAPDIIIISAGTNDLYYKMGIPNNPSAKDIRLAINNNYQNENGTIYLSEPTFDINDTYKDYRRTIAGSMRYCVNKLQELFPNAKIYILTPIHSCYATHDYITTTIKQEYITESAKHLGVPVIHVGEECGINADYEYQGAMWSGPTGYHEKSGRDLIDGLHPNENGSKKMAKYIAKYILNNY